MQAAYEWFNTSSNYAIYDSNITVLNPYIGGACTVRWTIRADFGQAHTKKPRVA